MRSFERIRDAALSAGFNGAWSFDPAGLRFLSEVRDMCAADKCHSYGRCWTCPPGCGSLEDSERLAAGFSHGVIMQTVGRLEDEFDFEGMAAEAKRHSACLDRLLRELRRCPEPIMPMGMGTCTRCEACTYPSEPCRFPELAVPSMEARGLMVMDVCKLAGAPYYYGPENVSYTSCVLY